MNTGATGGEKGFLLRGAEPMPNGQPEAALTGAPRKPRSKSLTGSSGAGRLNAAGGRPKRGGAFGARAEVVIEGKEKVARSKGRAPQSPEPARPEIHATGQKTLAGQESERAEKLMVWPLEKRLRLQFEQRADCRSLAGAGPVAGPR